ncbi:MAG: glycosyltransferase [Woeseiaceae bacterium]
MTAAARITAPTVALFLPSLDGGGAERVFVDLANRFATLGLRVDMVLASAAGPYLEELAPAVRVVDLGASGVIASLPRLARYLRTENPDALLSGLDHANLVAILANRIGGSRTRCVVSVRGVPSAVLRQERTVSRWLSIQLAKILYRFAAGIIANSDSVAIDVVKSLGVGEGRVDVVHNPLDVARIDELSRATVEHPWLAPGAPPVVLGVGRLSAVKDYRTLIDAFAIVRAKRDCRLVILGDGPDRDLLEAQLTRCGLQDDCHLPGFVANPFPWMRRASVLVSSSLTEGCPNVLLQALACGTPIVSTDCPGGSAEILANGKWGRLVAVGDSRSMADAVLATLDAREHPPVQRRAEDFAIGATADRYLRILLPTHASIGVGT